jgi:hypothetical protein
MSLSNFYLIPVLSRTRTLSRFFCMVSCIRVFTSYNLLQNCKFFKLLKLHQIYGIIDLLTVLSLFKINFRKLTSSNQNLLLLPSVQTVIRPRLISFPFNLQLLQQLNLSKWCIQICGDQLLYSLRKAIDTMFNLLMSFLGSAGCTHVLQSLM